MVLTRSRTIQRGTDMTQIIYSALTILATPSTAAGANEVAGLALVLPSSWGWD